MAKFKVTVSFIVEAEDEDEAEDKVEFALGLTSAANEAEDIVFDEYCTTDVTE
jgi:hypothetical protein